MDDWVSRKEILRALQHDRQQREISLFETPIRATEPDESDDPDVLEALGLADRAPPGST